MEQNKETKWYPNKVGTQWYIQSGPEQTAPDVLADIWVGEEQARENAILCSQTPELLQIAATMYKIIERHVYITQITPEEMEIINKYEELCKKE